MEKDKERQSIRTGVKLLFCLLVSGFVFLIACQAVEPEKPSSLSWLYIFGAVLLIFGLTLVFQQMSGTADGEVRPADIESLQAEIAELKGTISDLEERIDALENE